MKYYVKAFDETEIDQTGFLFRVNSEKCTWERFDVETNKFVNFPDLGRQMIVGSIDAVEITEEKAKEIMGKLKA